MRSLLGTAKITIMALSIEVELRRAGAVSSRLVAVNALQPRPKAFW